MIHNSYKKTLTAAFVIMMPCLMEATKHNRKQPSKAHKKNVDNVQRVAFPVLFATFSCISNPFETFNPQEYFYIRSKGVGPRHTGFYVNEGGVIKLMKTDNVHYAFNPENNRYYKRIDFYNSCTQKDITKEEFYRMKAIAQQHAQSPILLNTTSNVACVLPTVPLKTTSPAISDRSTSCLDRSKASGGNQRTIKENKHGFF